MAMEHYTEEVATQCDLNVNESSLKILNSISSPIDENNNSGGFDCNICLDSVLDPVVTMCGHLYCWPCIYKWIHYQTTSSQKSNHQQPQCPVCKVEISEKTLVPLYGPSSNARPTDTKTADQGMTIPLRPPSPRSMEITTSNSHRSPQNQNQNHLQHHHLYAGGSLVAPPNVGMYGEMVYARIFGNSEATLFTYYPNSYHHLAGSATPRVRRHIMEVDKSFSRLCFFLFCCMILCLLLF